jgi:hypothetical protein
MDWIKGPGENLKKPNKNDNKKHVSQPEKTHSLGKRKNKERHCGL